MVTRVDPIPEQLLGLPVVTAEGESLGVVVDVGLSNWRQPKFLLVAPPSPGARVVRIEYGAVAAVGDEVRLAMPLHPASLRS